jgi:teichuronic acid biosynthesis glycosyltransferase TuaG
MPSSADPREPLVSVVVPTYNQAEYLRSAIDSVLTQDYPSVELIVVDDGSTDATPDVLRDYGDAIILIRQPNRGAANALNEGIRAARGTYVCWLSSDDVFLPGKLRRQVDAFLDDPELAISFTGFVTIDAEGNDLRDRSDIQPVHPDLFVAVYWANPINGSTVMMPRAIFDQVGMFDESLRADVDGDMWLRVLVGRRAQHIPGAYLKYRVHGASLSANKALMLASKSRVRSARLRDGSLVARLRAFEPAATAATLAHMSSHFSRIGMADLARALFVAAMRAGLAPRAEARAARSLVTQAVPSPIREAWGASQRAGRRAKGRVRRVGRAVARRR